MSIASAVTDPHASRSPTRTPALASALPADLSHSPLLGILAVNMGAGIATSGRRVSCRWASPISGGTSASGSTRARGSAPRSTPPRCSSDR